MSTFIPGEAGDDIDEAVAEAVAQQIRNQDFSENAQLLTPFDPAKPENHRYMRMARSAMRTLSLIV